jgi:hypothetical protein
LVQRLGTPLDALAVRVQQLATLLPQHPEQFVAHSGKLVKMCWKMWKFIKKRLIFYENVFTFLKIFKIKFQFKLPTQFGNAGPALHLVAQPLQLLLNALGLCVSDTGVIGLWMEIREN